MKLRQYIFSLIFGLAGGSLAVGGYALFVKKDPIQSLTESQLSAPARYARYTPDGSMNFTTASAVATPAVVHIKSVSGNATAQGNRRRNQDDFLPFDLFDGFDMRRGPSLSSGSGVIISNDGYVVTNNHVIDNAEKLEVTLSDNRTYTGTVIGTDPSTDLAVIKIEAKELPYLKFGDSDKLLIGEWVLAVGNPFNLTSTVTAGIVSAKGRNINILEDRFKIESFIQTDAAVNPGNSGGALINIAGELIGINTAIASQTGSYAGYSFAVPANMVRKVVDDLLQFGTVQRGFLGVSIQDVNAQLAKDEDLSVSRGVYVNAVNEKSAAESAGMKKGDVIVRVADIQVNTASELQEQVARHRPGDKLKLTVLRNNKEVALDVVLKNQAGNTEVSRKEKSNALRELGAEFETLSNQEKKEVGVDHGVRISRIFAGKLRSAGIREGFVITGVDKQKVQNESDILKALEGKQGAILIEGTYGKGNKTAYAVMF